MLYPAFEGVMVPVKEEARTRAYFPYESVVTLAPELGVIVTPYTPAPAAVITEPEMVTVVAIPSGLEVELFS